MFLQPAKAATRLKKLSNLRPKLGIVLGSGFQSMLSRVEITAEIPYSKVPGFPVVGVKGHSGRLVLGYLARVPVVILCGRAHFYEGYGIDQITFPVAALSEFGVRDLLLTNAAGGINPRFVPGHYMYATDHINFMGVSPLRGPCPEGRPRFLDLTHAYSRTLSKMLVQAARDSGTKLHAGVYLAVSGPNYETPAEIRAFRKWGADAVGMSTVPEVIVARQYGMNVASLSCITNRAAGLQKSELSHSDVLALAGAVGKSTSRLMECFAERYLQRGS